MRERLGNTVEGSVEHFEYSAEMLESEERRKRMEAVLTAITTGGIRRIGVENR
jgi:hypothetical protein